jgi:predicted lipoprotein with Yx(FWY)xxD motif
MLKILLVAAAAAAVLAPAEAARGATLKVGSSDFGRILVDGRGHALYAFTRDGRGPSECYGACARAWPPFITKGKPRVGGGIRGAKLGTVRRADGRRQVTYAGRPLYFYVADTRPGQVLCQDVFEFGGRWLIMRGSGRLVR